MNWPWRKKEPEPESTEPQAQPLPMTQAIVIKGGEAYLRAAREGKWLRLHPGSVTWTDHSPATAPFLLVRQASDFVDDDEAAELEEYLQVTRLRCQMEEREQA